MKHGISAPQGACIWNSKTGTEHAVVGFVPAPRNAEYWLPIVLFDDHLLVTEVEPPWELKLREVTVIVHGTVTTERG